MARSLARDGIDAIGSLRASPPVDARNRAVVSAVLRLGGSTCLVRSAVLQRWDADHGRPRPLVVGVARSGDGAFAAHAWLEGDGDGDGFVEVHRRPPSPIASRRR